MRTIAVLPIKSFGAAKQRLSAMLGTGSREALAQAMFQDVLAALRRVPSIEAVAVVTADVVAESAARGNGVRILRDRSESGQSDAASIGIAYALDEGFDRALLVPGDTPLVDPSEVEGMLARAELAGTDVVIVPDRHDAGTNALLICPPAAMAPAFGEGSCARHAQIAREQGLAHRVERLPSLTLDVDTPEDLAELGRILDERRLAPMTRGALRQLERSGGRGSAPLRAAAAAAAGTAAALQVSI